MQECQAALKTITHLMNLPTEDRAQWAFLQQNDEMEKKLVSDMEKEGVPFTLKFPLVDKLPIRFDRLRHVFDEHQVFNSVTLDLAQGKLHVIRGPRGAGTTTLLKLAGRRTMVNL